MSSFFVFGKDAMRFVLFTEKTVSQCLKDINERLEARPTKTRPELDGWIEKGGSFSVAVTSRVLNRFNRTTRLNAQAARESGVTVIRGYVPDGVSPHWLRVLFAGLLTVTLILFLINEPMIGLLVFLFGSLLYVPLRGDYVNSETLLIEIERTLKASPTRK